MTLVFTSNSQTIRHIIAKYQTADKILIGGLRAGQADLLFRLLLSAVMAIYIVNILVMLLPFNELTFVIIIVATAIIIELRLPLGGGGQGGLNLPLPVPFNPGSRPVFFGSRPFAFFRLRNIAQCCIIFFPFSPASRHLGNPGSRPLFSRLPYTSRPLFSRSPAPLSPPHTPLARRQTSESVSSSGAKVKKQPVLF